MKGAPTPTVSLFSFCELHRDDTENAKYVHKQEMQGFA